MEIRLDGRTALITGGSKGLGLATAIKFAESGARVAILATGDEIVQLEARPEPHQIRNSNSYMLASLVRTAGGKPAILPVAHDKKEVLTGLLQQGLESDMLIVSGTHRFSSIAAEFRSMQPFLLSPCALL